MNRDAERHAPGSVDRRLAALAVLGVLLAGWLTHRSGLDGAFVFDDHGSIVGVAQVEHPDPWWRAFTGPERSGASGRPLTAVSLALDHARGGGGARAFHETNLALHLAAACALLVLLRRAFAPSLGPRRALVCAFAAATLWVVHPLHTAALWHTVYRNEILLALWTFLALFCADRRAAGGGRVWTALAVLAALAGVASKEPAAAIGPLVLAWDRAFHAGSLRAALRARPGLYLGLAATWLALAGFIATGERGASVGAGVAGVSRLDYLRTECGVIVHYLRLAFWPDPLVFDYHDWPIARSWGEVAPAALFVAALLAAGAWALARRPRLALAALLFFLVLAPSSSVIPITGAVCAEHRMVLPLVAPVVLVVLAAERALRPLPPRRATGVAALLLILVAGLLGAKSARRGALFRDPIALWRDTLAQRPRNVRAHENLAVLLAQAGRDAQAIGVLREALTLDARRPKAWRNLAVLLARTGRPRAALEAVRRALALDPADRVARTLEARLRAAPGSEDARAAEGAPLGDRRR